MCEWRAELPTGDEKDCFSEAGNSEFKKTGREGGRGQEGEIERERKRGSQLRNK